MALINQNNSKNKEIILICFNDNKYSLPTIISFNEMNNSIEIGERAREIRISNCSQTIFNIIKLIELNYKEINKTKNYWPFKLYLDEKTNTKYIKVNINREKDKKFSIIDLLIIYLKNIFIIFFNKLKIDNNNNNVNIQEKIVLKLSLVITVPNYFGYSQRKTLENIFKIYLFPNDEKINNYNNFQILLTKIKIENASSIASICLKDSSLLSCNIKNATENVEKKILIINIDGGSVNLSVTSLSGSNNKIFEVKNLSGTKFGGEDFIDTFMCECLFEFEEEARKECLNSFIALAKLRKSCEEAKDNFRNSTYTEICIPKLYETKDLKMIVNRKDYEKACNGMLEEIIELIKNSLIKSGVKAEEIDDIIIVGSSNYTQKLIQMIHDIFQQNAKIAKKLDIIMNNFIKKENDYDNYIVSGAALQAYNNNLSSPEYTLVDLSPISFGIESFDGRLNIIIEKGTRIPVSINKYIKISTNNNENHIFINIYEGDNPLAINNKLISKSLIDKNILSNEVKNNTFIEVLIQFELDSNLNLNAFILDNKLFFKKYDFKIGTALIQNTT